VLAQTRFNSGRFGLRAAGIPFSVAVWVNEQTPIELIGWRTEISHFRFQAYR